MLYATVVQGSEYRTEVVISCLEESSAKRELIVPFSFEEIFLSCFKSVDFFYELIPLIARSCQDKGTVLVDVVVIILLLRNESSSIAAHRESFLESFGSPYRNELLLRIREVVSNIMDFEACHG